jgi:hypothetical protein
MRLRIGIEEEDRWAYVRMDKGKVNIVPPSRQAKWFHLIGVPLGNATEMYPNGDEVQAVEPWTPPDIMGNMSDAQMDEILDKIDKGFPDGRRYTDVSSAKARAAWKVVVDVMPDMNEKQAREIIKTWVKKKVLETKTYRNSTEGKDESGLWKAQMCGHRFNRNESGAHCGPLRQNETAMVWGALGQGIAVAATAMRFWPLRLHCGYAAGQRPLRHPSRHCVRKLGLILIILVYGGCECLNVTEEGLNHEARI